MSELPSPATQSKDEVPFSFDELFFSRTDTRGIIQAGNSVFQRISHYEWEELLNKPHNVIRHPDMPKGVFHLFWDFLKNGKPIGAYVKNRAKDGRHYWVFAIATPVDGGFLSVRIKPSSDFLSVIENEYKALVVNEKTNKVSPADSAKKLIEDLKTRGFSNYEEFMAVAANKELLSLAAQVQKEEDPVMRSFARMFDVAHVLLKQTEIIFASYELNKYVPLNLQIQSAQLGSEGNTISVISSNYSIVSTEIRNEIDRFSRSASDVLEKIFAGQFLLATASIQKEVIEFFKSDDALTEDVKKCEMTRLETQQQSYRDKALEGLQVITSKIASFQEDCHKMKMLASSLEVIRIMGKVDASRLTSANGGLDELIGDLKDFQQSIASSLKEIDQINREFRSETISIVRTLQASAAEV